VEKEARKRRNRRKRRNKKIPAQKFSNFAADSANVDVLIVQGLDFFSHC
jgi:hypothetical protein